VLAAVRVLNRLERVGEAMRAAFNDLALLSQGQSRRLPADVESRETAARLPRELSCPQAGRV
jgi:hypothetical protein